ncbi:MAG TPA: hypothetical protein VES97_07925 [Solirubrobacteraceae bacterium]|nr:hypothetical protein [Solirubrobacteraceae bacterium]
MRSSTAAFAETTDAHPYRLDGWRTSSTLPRLLDTRVVRAELVRLRRPRPAPAAAERLELRSSSLTAGARDRA